MRMSYLKAFGGGDSRNMYVPSNDFRSKILAAGDLRGHARPESARAALVDASSPRNFDLVRTARRRQATRNDYLPLKRAPHFDLLSNLRISARSGLLARRRPGLVPLPQAAVPQNLFDHLPLPSLDG